MEYGYDEHSYKDCTEIGCEGGKIIDMTCENASLMTCPKCNGDGEILMEYEEFQAKQRDDLESETDLKL